MKVLKSIKFKENIREIFLFYLLTSHTFFVDSVYNKSAFLVINRLSYQQLTAFPVDNVNYFLCCL